MATGTKLGAMLLLGLTTCGPPPAASFFLEDGNLAVAFLTNPNEPPPRQETWERTDSGWRHCSRIDIPQSRERVQAALSATQRTYTPTDTGWTEGTNVLTFEEMGLGGNRLSLCADHGAAEGDPLLDGFLRTALSQLNFADAKAFMDAQGLEPHAVERSWAPSEGAMAGVVVELPDARLEPALKYLGSTGLLPSGKELHTTARPDDSSATVLVRPGTDGSPTTVSLVVENRRNSQLW